MCAALSETPQYKQGQDGQHDDAAALAAADDDDGQHDVDHLRTVDLPILSLMIL